MIGNLIAWLVLVALALGFAWLVRRAWRAKNSILKWGGVVLAGLLTLVLALVSITAAIGLYQFYVPRGSPIAALKVAGTPEQIARGQHLARILCAGCHTTNGELPLSGGRDVGTEANIPLGSFVSINLTPAGPLKDWSDGEIMRVLNEGVDRNGHPLFLMSLNTVRYFSDEDKQAVIAYLRSQPPVVNVTPDPPDNPTLLLAVMVGAGVIQFQPPVKVVAPPRGETAEYGKYIEGWRDCRFCHGPDLGGGTGEPAGLTPKGPNLRVVQGWTREQFIATLRTGKDPGGRALDNAQMPWKEIGLLDDDELGAVYAYLKSLPPVQK